MQTVFIAIVAFMASPALPEMADANKVETNRLGGTWIAKSIEVGGEKEVLPVKIQMTFMPRTGQVRMVLGIADEEEQQEQTAEEGKQQEAGKQEAGKNAPEADDSEDLEGGAMLGTYWVDSTKRPCHLNLKFEEEDGQQIMPTLFEIVGDELIICMDYGGGARITGENYTITQYEQPPKFESDMAGDFILLRLKRKP